MTNKQPRTKKAKRELAAFEEDSFFSPDLKVRSNVELNVDVDGNDDDNDGDGSKSTVMQNCLCFLF